jgi:hypothetical protein
VLLLPPLGPSAIPTNAANEYPTATFRDTPAYVPRHLCGCEDDRSYAGQNHFCPQNSAYSRYRSFIAPESPPSAHTNAWSYPLPNPMANKANMIPCRPCAFGILRGQAVARGSFDNFRGNSDSSPLNLRTSKERNRGGRVRTRKAVFRLVGEDQ